MEKQNSVCLSLLQSLSVQNLDSADNSVHDAHQLQPGESDSSVLNSCSFQDIEVYKLLSEKGGVNRKDTWWWHNLKRLVTSLALIGTVCEPGQCSLHKKIPFLCIPLAGGCSAAGLSLRLFIFLYCILAIRLSTSFAQGQCFLRNNKYVQPKDIKSTKEHKKVLTDRHKGPSSPVSCPQDWPEGLCIKTAMLCAKV